MATTPQRALVAGLLVMTLAGVAAASEAWVKLGERSVSDRVERDVIVVGADQGQFSAIRLKVVKRPVHILDLKVHFANGGVQDVEVRKVIKAGSESRVIDLRGDDRVIATVELWYEAESARRHKGAKVVLFGRR
jgi:hypothetical protein